MPDSTFPDCPKCHWNRLHPSELRFWAKKLIEKAEDKEKQRINDLCQEFSGVLIEADRKIIEMRLGGSATWEDIGRALFITRERAKQKFNAACKRLAAAKARADFIEWRNNNPLDPDELLELDLSVRSYNGLKKLQINKISELCEYSCSDLLAIRNFGPGCLDNVKARLAERGLSLKD